MIIFIYFLQMMKVRLRKDMNLESGRNLWLNVTGIMEFPELRVIMEGHLEKEIPHLKKS